MLRKRNFILSFLISLLAVLSFQSEAIAKYFLVIGSYRQGPGTRPEVSGITSPTLHSIPMETLSLCNAAGEEITDAIYKKVWQFDHRWTCVEAGNI